MAEVTTDREAQLTAALREYEAGVKTTELERAVIEAAIEWRKREQGEPMIVDEYEARTALGQAVGALIAAREGQSDTHLRCDQRR